MLKMHKQNARFSMSYTKAKKILEFINKIVIVDAKIVIERMKTCEKNKEEN